jgi:OmpR-family two-component system manganese-sensing sensor histidine kinase
VIGIEDTGIGIASKHLPLIFNCFWREEGARSHQEGTGLGLAIAQAIAQHHGGEIRVTSRLGIGSHFQVYLLISE